MVKKAGRPVWSSPPAAPDRAIITRDTSCLGILGMTLQNALQSLQTNSTMETVSRGNNGDNDNDNDATTTDKTKNNISKSSVFEDQRSIDRIMKSFAEAVAQSYETMSSSTIPTTTNTNTQSDDKKRSVPVAPSAVICGKVDHYNRRSDKWRFIVRNSKIVERKQYNASHFSTRVRQKPMFWNVATATAIAAGGSVGDATTAIVKTTTIDSNHILMSKYSNEVLSLKGDLEVLAYNDR